jgi:hypothetical protein
LIEGAYEQLKLLPLWAQVVPQFNELELDDQVSLLRTSRLFLFLSYFNRIKRKFEIFFGNKIDWREIIVATTAYRSMSYEDSILSATGYLFKVNSCQDETLAYMLERLSQDIAGVMRDLNVDLIETALLKAIFLFDPGQFFFQRAPCVNNAAN